MRNKTCLITVLFILASLRIAAGAALESVGNAPLSGYREWPGILPLLNHKSRVYQIWISGGEAWYYRGNTRALNAALKSFAAVRSKELVVVLRPGQPTVTTLKGVRIAFDWKLHVDAGLAAAFGGRPPTLTVYIGGNVGLDGLVIPPGLTVVGPSELREEYLRDLSNTNRSTVIHAANCLVELEPDNPDNVPALTELLDNPDHGIVLAAGRELSNMGSAALTGLPQLERARDRHTSINREALERAIQRIRDAQAGPLHEPAWYQLSRQIDAYIVSLPAGRLSTGAASQPASRPS